MAAAPKPAFENSLPASAIGCPAPQSGAGNTRDSVPEQLGGLRIADAVLERRGKATGEIERPPHVIGASGAQGAIHKQLPQHVMLGVAPAHALRICKNRPHQIESDGILAMPVREHRLAHGKRDLAHHRELLAGVENGPAYRVGKLSLGAVRDFRIADHLSLGAGGLLALNFVPGPLQPLYGGSNPTGLMGFVRLKLN